METKVEVGLFQKQQELSERLRLALTDKDKVKLLLRTIEDNITVDNTYERVGIISFAVGYLGSLLVKHNLNDWSQK